MSAVRVCALAELADGEARRVELGDDDAVALVRIGDGEVDERACTLECPTHGSEFDLRTGVPRSLPALRPVPTYEVSVVDGDVFVEIGVES